MTTQAVVCSGTMERVSVYIPCYNCDDYVREVLPAVAAQDCPIAEIVLVDDGSEPPLKVALPGYPPTRVVHHQVNLGVAAARNTALKEIGSELVVSFDADIVPERSCIAELVKAISNDQTVVGVGGRVTERFCETAGDLLRARYMQQDRGEEVLHNVDLFGGCTLYRRSKLQEIGGYTEMLRNSFEDIDVARRSRARGGRTLYVPSARGEHVKRDTVISAVDTLYRWSYPHWESDQALANHDWLRERVSYPPRYYERAVASTIGNLEYKIRADMTLALGRIKRCQEPRVLYPLILYPIRAVLHDLLSYRECGGARAAEISDLFGDLLAVLLHGFMAPSLSLQLQRDSSDLTTALYGSPQWQERNKRARAASPDLRSLLNVAAPEAPPIQGFIEFFSAMLAVYSEHKSGASDV